MPDNAINPIIQKYTVDFAGNNNFLFVKGIQGDGYATRFVDLSLMNNGQPYLIDTNAVTAIIRGTKPDGKVIFNECEVIDENTIRAEITQQMSAVSGKSNYEISIMSNSENKTITSFPFFIVISQSSFDVGYVVSSDEFGLLSKKIIEVNDLKNDFKVIKDEFGEIKIESEKAIEDCEKSSQECKDAITNYNEVVNDVNNKVNEAILRSDSATERANDISSDLEQKLQDGYFNGSDGKDGIITTVPVNHMAFSIIDGHLIVTYEDGNTDANKFSIDSTGHLIYTFD